MSQRLIHDSFQQISKQSQQHTGGSSNIGTSSQTMNNQQQQQQNQLRQQQQSRQQPTALQSSAQQMPKSMINSKVGGYFEQSKQQPTNNETSLSSNANHQLLLSRQMQPNNQQQQQTTANMKPNSSKSQLKQIVENEYIQLQNQYMQITNSSNSSSNNNNYSIQNAKVSKQQAINTSSSNHQQNAYSNSNEVSGKSINVSGSNNLMSSVHSKSSSQDSQRKSNQASHHSTSLSQSSNPQQQHQSKTTMKDMMVAQHQKKKLSLNSQTVDLRSQQQLQQQQLHHQSSQSYGSFKDINQKLQSQQQKQQKQMQQPVQEVQNQINSTKLNANLQNQVSLQQQQQQNSTKNYHTPHIVSASIIEVPSSSNSKNSNYNHNRNMIVLNSNNHLESSAGKSQKLAQNNYQLENMSSISGSGSKKNNQEVRNEIDSKHQQAQSAALKKFVLEKLVNNYKRRSQCYIFGMLKGYNHQQKTRKKLLPLILQNIFRQKLQENFQKLVNFNKSQIQSDHTSEKLSLEIDELRGEQDKEFVSQNVRGFRKNQHNCIKKAVYLSAELNSTKINFKQMDRYFIILKQSQLEATSDIRNILMKQFFQNFKQIKIHENGSQQVKVNFLNDIDICLMSIKIESEQICRLFLSTYNKNPQQVIQFRVLDPSIFMDQELNKVIEILKNQISGHQMVTYKLQFPFQQVQTSAEYSKIQAIFKVQNIMQNNIKTDVKLVRSFRIWQKCLLNKYLDLISQNMRKTKKKVLHQRFIFITKLIQFRQRQAFKKWNLRAKILSAQTSNSFDLRKSSMKPQFGALQVLNRLLNFRKESMSLPSPLKSKISAFQQWKINIDMPLTFDYTLRNRVVSLTLLANSIMMKNLSFIKKLAFHEIKDMSDSKSKHLQQKFRSGFHTNNSLSLSSQQNAGGSSSPFYKSIIIPRLDDNQKAKLVLKIIRDRENRENLKSMRLMIDNWKMHVAIAREAAIAQQQNMRNQSFKRRWENPKIKEQFNDQSYRCGYSIIKGIYQTKKLHIDDLNKQKIQRQFFKTWQRLIFQNTDKSQSVKNTMKNYFQIFNNILEKNKQLALNKWKRVLIKQQQPISVYTKESQYINNAIIQTQAQINQSLEDKINQRLEFIQQNKHRLRMIDFCEKLQTIENRKMNEVFQTIRLYASQYLTNQKQIRDKFEMIEREKQIMEDEYGNSLTLNEDLQYQFEAIVKVSCQRCYQNRAQQQYGVTQFDQIQYYSNGSSQNGYYQQNTVGQRPSIIVEEAIESSMSNMDMTKTDKSLKRPIDQYNSQFPPSSGHFSNQDFNNDDEQDFQQNRDSDANFREELTSMNNQNQIMQSTGVSNFGSGHQSGRSTTDFTRSSPSNLLSRMTIDSGANSIQNYQQNSGFLQARRFTFSPMIGSNANQLTAGYQVIQESQNECESSFKTDNSQGGNNLIQIQSQPMMINSMSYDQLQNAQNVDLNNNLTAGGSSKDIVHQYFDFLHKENENLNFNIYQLEQQHEQEELQYSQEMEQYEQKIKSLEAEILEIQNQAKGSNLRDEMRELEDFDF
eukprot:403349357